MRKQNIITVSIIILAVIGLVIYQQDLIPVTRNSSGVGSGAQETPQSMDQAGTSNVTNAARQNWAQGDTGKSVAPLAMDHIHSVLANVNPEQRGALLENKTAFQEFVNQEASQRSLLAAARSNKLQDDENISFLMDRAANNVLRELYVDRLISSRIPADFPSEEQIQEYFNNNRDNLVIEERVSVWQIFLPVPESMSDEEVATLQEQAAKIVADIRQNNTDFTTAALTWSAHQSSKLNGGYMGILKVSELIPGVRESLMDLPEGQVSDPVRSDMGFHILKRDEIIPSQDVTLDQVRGQIRNLLINQVRTKLGNEVLKLATETYPMSVDEETIEIWRSDLKNSF